MWLCDDCGLSYSHKPSLQRHIKVSHKYNISTNPAPVLGKFKCSVCSQEYSKKEEILTHFHSDHDINLETVSKCFDSFELFKEWKKQLEEETTAKYNLMFGSEQNKKYGTVYYICHRSGCFKSRGKGTRVPRRRGSKKINGFCPSSIRVKIKENGSCSVTIIPTHVGHENEVCLLRQTSFVEFRTMFPTKEHDSYPDVNNECNLSIHSNSPNFDSTDIENMQFSWPMQTETPSELLLKSGERLFIIEPESEKREENEIVFQDVGENLNMNNNLYLKKTELQSHLEEMINIVKCIESIEDAETIEKLLLPLKHFCHSLVESF